MGIVSNMIGALVQDIYPEAENQFVAYDMYVNNLLKRIILKDNAQVDCNEEKALLSMLQAHRQPIIDKVAGEYARSQNAG